MVSREIMTEIAGDMSIFQKGIFRVYSKEIKSGFHRDNKKLSVLKQPFP